VATNPHIVWKRFLAGRSLGLILCLAILVIAAVPAAKRDWYGKTGDFTHFWHAAQALAQGQDIYAAGTGDYIYPPLIAFLFQPLTLVSEPCAALVWLGLNALIVLAAALISAHQAVAAWLPERNASSCIVAALAMALTTDKIRAIFVLGQTDCLMLLGFALILRWMNPRPFLAGGVTGAAANIKYLTLVFVVYFLIKRNYRAAMASIVSFAVFLFLPAIQIGWPRALEYAGVAFAGLGKLLGLASVRTADISDIAWDRSISITSALFRLTRTLALPDLVAGTLTLGILALIVGAILVLGRRQRVPIFAGPTPANPLLRNEVLTLEWAVMIFIALAFSPQTTARHMVLVLEIFVVALAVLIAQPEFRPRIPLIAALAAMVAGLTFPPFGIGLNRAYWVWKAIAGPSWCAASFILALVSVGSRTIGRRQTASRL
jgi:Glycosyltransferase family 87